jgi:hypothetical protein
MEEGIVTMCYVQGLFILGKLEYEVNKKNAVEARLINPRVFTAFIEKEGGKDVPKVNLAPPPGTPAYIVLENLGFAYPYPPTDNVLKLYAQVTAPPEKRVITGVNEN